MSTRTALMRRQISLVLAALLTFARAVLIALALWEDSYHGLAGAAVFLIISLAWSWENRRA